MEARGRREVKEREERRKEERKEGRKRKKERKKIQTKRWTVNRSPHGNKKAREQRRRDVWEGLKQRRLESYSERRYGRV